jgi:hypothetical protein
MRFEAIYGNPREANSGSELFRYTFSANSNSDPDFLANICYTLPSYGSPAGSLIEKVIEWRVLLPKKF